MQTDAPEELKLVCLAEKPSKKQRKAAGTYVRSKANPHALHLNDKTACPENGGAQRG